jgi:hypothetical protein
MNLDLSDEEAALTKDRANTAGSDRYPFRHGEGDPREAQVRASPRALAAAEGALAAASESRQKMAHRTIAYVL